MIETVLFSIIFSRLKGNKWPIIYKLLKHWSFYPIIMTCIFNLYIIYSMVHGDYRLLEYAKYIKTTIYKYKLFNMSIFSKIKYENSHIMTTVTSPVSLGVLCMWIGSGLNYIAMWANNWKMPIFSDVSFSTGYSKIDMFNNTILYNDSHTFGNYTTNLIFLTDIFDCFYSVMSIGDILIRAFVVLIIYYSVKNINDKNINNI